jgi:mono/diheme cytochrome c family protein
MRIVVLGLVALACIAAAPKKPAALPKGLGQALVQAKCSGCHALLMVTAKRKTADQWGQSVDNMIDRGAKVSDADYDVIVAYLAKNFGVK